MTFGYIRKKVRTKSTLLYALLYPKTGYQTLLQKKPQSASASNTETYEPETQLHGLLLCAKVRVNSALFSSRTVTGYHDFHVKSRTFMCFFKPFSMTVSCPVPFPVLPEFRILFPVKIRTELLLFRQTAKRNVFVCRDGWYKLSCFPDK